LSLEALQVRVTRLEAVALAVRAVGTDGAAVSGGDVAATAVLLAAEALAELSSATT
jgi:hypothetical protein